MFLLLYAAISVSTEQHLPSVNSSYLPTIWILLVVRCRNYRGVGQYWRGKQPKSMGYWKNHPEEWPVEEVKICNVSYPKRQAIQILKGANSKDATNMLTVQLIIVKLNRRCGVSPEFKYQDQTLNVDQVINNAENFLCTHPFGSNPRGNARQEALHTKNMLYDFNNNCD
jgi:hypothetical protein